MLYKFKRGRILKVNLDFFDIFITKQMLKTLNSLPLQGILEML